MAKRELTLKQRLFIKEYIKNGGNATGAAETVGYKCKSKESFGVVAHNLLRRVKGRITDIMEARGIDEFKLTQVLDEGLSLPARHSIRLKYLDTAHRLRGDYAPLKQEVTGKDGGPIEVKPKGTIFDKLDKYAKLFESNGGGEKGTALGNGPGESVDTSPADNKTG